MTKFGFKLTKGNGTNALLQDYMSEDKYFNEFVNEFIKIIPSKIRFVDNKNSIFFSVIADKYSLAEKKWQEFSENYRTFAEIFAKKYGVKVKSELSFFAEGEKLEKQFRYDILIPEEENKKGSLRNYAKFSNTDYSKFINGLKDVINETNLDIELESRKNRKNSIDEFIVFESTKKDADLVINILKDKYSIYAGQFAVKNRLNVKKTLDVVYKYD